MAVGQTKAPYYYAGDNTMNIIKVINKISAPDSIQLRQIQVAGADMNAIQKTADSIMTALHNGVAFDSIAKKYNQTGEKTWITSRNYEGAPLDGDNLKFIKTITNMPVNATEKIDFAQGWINAQVTDRRAMINKYDVAVIARLSSAKILMQRLITTSATSLLPILPKRISKPKHWKAAITYKSVKTCSAMNIM